MKTYIKYISNAGVFIKFENKGFLIDPFVNFEQNLPYKKITPYEYNKILNNISPYEKVTNLIITHNHPDHFDNILSNKFLEKNNDIFVNTTDEVKNMLNYKGKSLDSNIIEIPTIHTGFHFKNKEHKSFIINVDGLSILILGDIKMYKANFDLITNIRSYFDICIANYTFLQPEYTKLRDLININNLFILHIPTNFDASKEIIPLISLKSINKCYILDKLDIEYNILL
jgi:L-ascorbate metabolism protein UlaG (beta-lactamase superfamily)